jgi:ankyrin repeat protein
VTASTWHQKCGWKAEDYFEDPQVIALCRAIEANDIAEIDRLVAAGADVNAKGKGNMTPLLWAFPDNKLERFKRLLEHGANPNVVIESDFNTRGGMRSGDSVTHMACKTGFPGYFETVFTHGADPNVIKNGIISNQTPIFTLLTGSAQDKKGKVKALIDKRANLDHMDGGWSTPVMMTVSMRRYDIALMLLEAGANHMIYKPKSNTRLIHIVVGQERLSETWTPQQGADYKKLVKWLVDRGESTDAAKADIQRWHSWSITTGEFQRKMAAEVAARKIREAREKAAINQRDQENE